VICFYAIDPYLKLLIWKFFFCTKEERKDEKNNSIVIVNKTVEFNNKNFKNK
jgi:hypothetical protein